MGQLTPIAEADILAATLGPTQLAAGEHEQILALAYVRLRVVLRPAAPAPVVLRPWFWRDSYWFPLRGDGAATGGAAPVTADITVKGGRADGFFFAGGLSHEVAIAVESGDPDDVVACWLEPADSNL